jgi:putative redox protein
MKITVKRTDDAFHFEGINQDGKTVHMDAAEKIGGRNQGARPTELVLMALAGCSGIDVVNILKKQRVQLDDFYMDVDGEQESLTDAAKIFTEVKIVFHLKGNMEPEKARRAVDLSVEKYCSVEKILRLSGAKIKYEVFLNDKSV